MRIITTKHGRKICGTNPKCSLSKVNKRIMALSYVILLISQMNHGRIEIQVPPHSSSFVCLPITAASRPAPATGPTRCFHPSLTKERGRQSSPLGGRVGVQHAAPLHPAPDGVHASQRLLLQAAAASLDALLDPKH